MNRNIILVFIALILASQLFAQEVKLPNTRMVEFPAKAVSDTFEVYISFPPEYDTTDVSYPVIYLLDGEVHFPILYRLAHFMKYGKVVPQAIIVGVGYGELTREVNMRDRDYTPTQVEGRTRTGQAGNFLAFLGDELIPYIDSNYRTLKEDRTLFGFSLGGLFSFYAMFNRPELFDNYICGSPFVAWDNGSIYKEEEKYASSHNALNARVYFSVGELEDEGYYQTNMRKMKELLEQRNYEGLEYTFVTYEDGTHYTTPARALVEGLTWLFDKEKTAE